MTGSWKRNKIGDVTKNFILLTLTQSAMSSYLSHNVTLFYFTCIKTCVVCSLTNRKEETVIAQLHIGHSFIIHSFLLKGEEPPMCFCCDESLTIKHILLICSDLIEVRQSHFAAQSLHELFQEISPEKIFTFWKRSIFWNNFNSRSLLVMFVSYFPL